MHELCNVVEEKTYLKNMQNPSSLDLLSTNNVHSFQQTIVICTILSDCHKPVLTVLKTTVPRSQPKETTYRDYKQLDSSKFRNEMKNVFTKENIHSCSESLRFLKVLKSHAPMKRKTNHAQYTSKTLQKAIMKRSCLGKIDHSLKAYKKQKIPAAFIKKKGKT